MQRGLGGLDTAMYAYATRFIIRVCTNLATSTYLINVTRGGRQKLLHESFIQLSSVWQYAVEVHFRALQSVLREHRVKCPLFWIVQASTESFILAP